MALNVISNFAANTAHRNLVLSDLQATDSLSKLSSGTRVRSAKDDAASLAIGSRLNAEVQAMRQASSNTVQAASMLQIADGAYATVSDILVRMKSLAVQSGSENLSSTERTILNTEYQQIKSEIDRIAEDTEFNGVQMIAGSAVNTTGNPADLSTFGIESLTLNTSVHTSTGDVYRVTYSSSTTTFTFDILEGKSTGVEALGNGVISLSSADVTAINALTGAETLEFTDTTRGITITIGESFATGTDITSDVATNNLAAASTMITTATSAFTANTTVGTGISTSGTAGLAALSTSLDANGAYYNADTGVLTLKVLQAASAANTLDIQTMSGVSFSAGYDTLTAGETTAVTIGGEVFGSITFSAITSTATTAVEGGYVQISLGQGLVQNTYASSGGSTTFTFKVGTGATAAADNLTFTIDSATTTVLGINATVISGSDGTNADNASTLITSAINTLNTSRATIGAGQNRLSFASNNLAAAIENAEAARSNLMDLDVAAEIAVFTSKQILVQTGVSMLAQANQLPQNLLRLFQ